MSKLIFCVFDSKAEFYNLPFFAVSVGEVLRMFTDEVNNPNSLLCKHPEDYTLFQLGSYYDQNASFDLLPTPKPLGKALEFVCKGQAA